MKKFLFVGVVIIGVGFSFAVPSFVLTRNRRSNEKILIEKEEPTSKRSFPDIYEFDIQSNISNRFAKTLVTSKVRNAESDAQEATFSVVLPEKAFISEFVMEINGESYKAYVKEKEEAKNIYDQARRRGESAGYVGVSARDSNRFTVSVNVEPETKATFFLTYEELLERKNDKYELVLNIQPGQIVKNLNVMVLVNESRPLQFVKTPSIRSGNEISKNDETLNPSSTIRIINSNTAVVTFRPDIEEQKKFVKSLGGKENEGLTGQFVVQYEVERDPKGGEVLLEDGYFVHFFAPSDLKPIPKHLVFILDTSGSMYGTKLKQLKEAMTSILDDLNEVDVFHIIEFNTDVFVWNIETGMRVKAKIENDREPFEDLLKIELPGAIEATKDAISKGKAVIEKLQDEDLTNMMSSISTGLHVVRRHLKKNSGKERHQPIIVFLTDGEPTIGIDRPEDIINVTSRLNEGENKVPIFSLSFGDGADKDFLRKFSMNNLGFSRHIYEAADASLQIQDFYQQIASPLLTNVHFKYVSDVKAVSKTDFPLLFKGSELVVVGKYKGDLICSVDGFGEIGMLSLKPSTETPISSLERLWAYLTVKQKLEERETIDNKTQLTEEALQLALKYSFVTDVSSLVVVKPNDSMAVDTQDASKTDQPESYGNNVLRFNMAGLDDDLDMDGAAISYTNVVSGSRDSDAVDVRFGGSDDLYSALSNVVTSDWKDQLPWLKNVLTQNNTLKVSEGEFELGEPTDIYLRFSCPATPLNSTQPGVCVVLKDCPVIYDKLTSFQVYQQYFCSVDRYAGICCPLK